MLATVPRRASENRSEQSYRCPLCDCAADSQDDIYCHLLVSHRKSSITAAFLEQTALDTE